MSRITEILATFDDVAAHPRKAIDAFIQETGKGAVGFAYVYGPEEIVHAAGLLPVGMWGAHVPISKARAYLPPFACSIAQSIMELECSGVYDVLSAVVFCTPCDTLKCMSQMWRGKCPSLTFVHPQNRGLEAANIYLAQEYRNLKERLEAIIGQTISDAAITRSIAVYNANRRIMRTFSDIAADHPDIIDPLKRHAVNKARFFMDKARHTALVTELVDELNRLPKAAWKGPRIVLSGIMAEPDGFLDIFKEAGFAVVADDLAQESRQYRHDVPDASGHDDPLYRLAQWWQALDGCSLATDPSKHRGAMLIDMVSRHKADGVVMAQMKFCEPEEFDFPIIYQQLDQAGIPNLMIEVDLEANAFEQIKTRVQTFRDVLA